MFLGKNNNISDAISRFQWPRFRQLAPTADNGPCQMPPPFWEIIHQLYIRVYVIEASISENSSTVFKQGMQAFF